MPVTFTTQLPDVGQPTLDGTVASELTVSWVDSIDYGSYRVQIREEGAAAWDSTATGFAEQTNPHDGATEVTFSVLDGHRYEVRMRTETEHKTRAWTSTETTTIKLPAPSSVSASSSSSTDVDVSWTDNSGGEVGFRVVRSERHPDDGYLAYEDAKEVAANTVSTTDDTATPGRDYRYKVEAYTDHATARSTAYSEATTIAEFPCGRGGVIFPLGDYREIYHMSVDGRWVKFGDIYFDSNTDLTLVMEGEFDIYAQVEHITGDPVIGFGVWARQPNADSDVRVENLSQESWYRMQFDGVLARTASGRAHGQSTLDGNIEFNEVIIPNE